MRRRGQEIARTALVTGVLAGMVAVTPLAKADDLASCMASHEAGQVARLDGQLLVARKKLRACAAEACPVAMRHDCLDILAEVDHDLPSIVVGAAGDEGDLDDVVVTVDGVVVRRKLDGLPIDLDPGSHEFIFETPGKATKRQTVVVRVGERKRLIKVDWSTRRTAADAASSSPPMYRPVPGATYLFGGLSLVGAVSFGVFAGVGRVEQKDLEKCRPFCTPEAVNRMTTRYRLADASLAFAGASAITSLVFYLARPSQPAATTTFGVLPTHQGAFATINVLLE